MTDNRALKETIRRRMQQTGEKYTEARRALRAPVGPLEPGEVRILVIVWQLDDPAVQSDARFWLKVPQEAADRRYQRPVETSVPHGQSLARWRRRADGGEIELASSIDHQKARLSLRRWSGANPERTYMIIAFQQLPRELAGLSKEELQRHQNARPAPLRAARRTIPALSEAATRLKGEQAELQRCSRGGSERGDEELLADLVRPLDTKAQEPVKSAVPNLTRGWECSRAIRRHPNIFILDWTTGY